MRALPLLVLAGLLLAAAPASAIIVTNPNRLDLGELRREATFEPSFRVINKGAEAVDLALTPRTFEPEDISVSPDRFTLAPGASQDVRVVLRVAANTSGGRHDPRIEIVEMPASSSGQAVARAGLSIPVVYFVENLKIGNTEIRSFERGTGANVRVLVQNFLKTPSTADVTLELLDPNGAEVASKKAPTQTIPRNASASVFLDLPIGKVPAGKYTLRATAGTGAFESNSWSVPLKVGAPRMVVGEPKATPLGNGRYAYEAVVRNEGDLTGTVVVVFRVTGATTVASNILTIPPGESRNANAEGRADPGARELTAVARFDGEESLSPAATVVVPAPPEEDKKSRWFSFIPDPTWLAGAAALGAAFLRRKRT